ncbi:S8 family peptidase [Flavivirga jejuensis]|uniref:S8 family serine peptidase n=1 Tax=Flavivirga jejuensis TaxID=870487 RepID=A0ABT8WTB8_9FLAO|nr:S8 family serine peptidase [Flavivirga jejuensis]MDO5976136.1 S8 family serine peptidase [Flavivirga jejuensis]
MVSYRFGGEKGQKINLKEANSLVAIRFNQEHLNWDQLNPEKKRLVDNLMLVSSFPEALVNIYHCNALGDLSGKQIRNQVRKLVSKEDNVRFAGRVFIDNDNGIHLYTENIFIKFKEHLSEPECTFVLDSFELSVKKKVTYAANAYFVAAKSGVGKKVFDIANSLLDKKEVELCHPELIRYKKKKNIYEQQWHLKKTKLNNTDVDAHINVLEAWKHTKGNEATIAIIDDGIDIDHPEFNTKGKVVHPWDATLKTSDPRPKFKYENHGTACAGVACASGIKMASGVAPDSKLMPIRLNSNLGSMNEAEAFVWAADNGADIISCSWGPRDGNWSDPSDPTHTRRVRLPDSTRLAIDYATSKGRNGNGCLIVWAAGNGRENIYFDGYASYPKVMAIGACNDTDKRSVYSDFGKELICSFPSNDFEYPLFNHPKPITEGIWTTDVQGGGGYNVGDYTATFGGTSSACPGVAGILALLVSLKPNISFSEVIDLIKLSCDKIDKHNANYDNNGHSIYYGYGKLNAGTLIGNV